MRFSSGRVLSSGVATGHDLRKNVRDIKACTDFEMLKGQSIHHFFSRETLDHYLEGRLLVDDLSIFCPKNHLSLPSIVVAESLLPSIAFADPLVAVEEGAENEAQVF